MPRDKKFLQEIANDVDELIQNPVNMKRFLEQYEKFCEAKNENPDIIELLTIPHKPSKITQYMFPDSNPTCYNEDQRIMARYVLLTIIHDKTLTALTTPKIIENTKAFDCRHNLFEDTWQNIQHDFCYNEENQITPALELVKKDLFTETPASTNEINITIEPIESEILNYVCDKYPEICYQEKISITVKRSRNTVSHKIKNLKELGLLCTPQGKRDGVTATPKGIEYHNSYFA